MVQAFEPLLLAQVELLSWQELTLVTQPAH